MRLRAIALLSLVLVVVGVMATAAVEAGEQGRRPHRWWQSDEVTALLGLTSEQSVMLDKIYRRALPKLRESMRRLNAEERTLSRLVADMEVEEIDVTRQIDRVEAARSEASKTRILMVFRMHRILTDTQRDALDEWMKPDPDENGSDRSQRRRR
ncbi:MAG: periplasmic heavy metal sensor [Vicinamibacterales bacterium]|jgi:Spy/CpxP family protein refolding chaperone|nr:periplasmic heavy metal sensor [Vicinamibacterales bacterium]